MKHWGQQRANKKATSMSDDDELEAIRNVFVLLITTFPFSLPVELAVFPFRGHELHSGKHGRESMHFVQRIVVGFL